jgi:acyl-CoA ligase (AMP-forming) (exosortase A-associated)
MPTTTLLPDLILASADRAPERVALRHRQQSTSYGRLAALVERFARALVGVGLGRGDRVGVYLPKQLETAVTLFGANRAGGVFVPLNPVLKAAQVGHILRDCNLRVLVTSSDRLASLAAELGTTPALERVVLVDTDVSSADLPGKVVGGWQAFLDAAPDLAYGHRLIDTDVASILYTSGSTGRPKGVVLSHRNMMTGAKSVAQYLENKKDDVLLAVLPLSFDYGFSQLSTAFHVGASVVLMDYLFPRDVVNLVAREHVTGLAAVPPIWIQLADVAWPDSVAGHLRYFTNSGGRMPRATLDKLRAALPTARPYLMYGLTEAFRATYLPPDDVDRRPDSIGKAIPNTEVMVVRPDGSPCEPDEPGELVQRGSLVALGYWNDPAKTAERFRPVPGQRSELPLTEMAVWSGDTVRKDADGYLYFVGRRDEMIKTSGYRVSPTEVEEIAYASGQVGDAVAVAAPHPALGEGIVLVASPPAHDARPEDTEGRSERLLDYLRAQAPSYMLPQHVAWLEELPRNPNGKFDRPALAALYRAAFAVSA